MKFKIITVISIVLAIELGIGALIWGALVFNDKPNDKESLKAPFLQKEYALTGNAEDIEFKTIGGGYDEISKIDSLGEKMLFKAREGAEWFVVEEDKKWGPFESRCLNILNIIPDKLTFVASRNGNKIIFHDSKEMGPYYLSKPSSGFFEDSSCYLDFRRSGDGFVYLERNNGEWLVVQDNNEQLGNFLTKEEALNYLNEIAKQTDSSNREYSDSQPVRSGTEDDKDTPALKIEKKGKQWAVFYAGKKVGVYDEVMHYYGQDDFLSHRMVNEKPAIRAKKNGKIYVIYGKTELGPYDMVGRPGGVGGIQNIGNNLAFEFKRNGEWYVYYKNNEIGPYDNIGKRTQVNYGVQEVNDTIAFGAEKGDEFVIYYHDSQIVGPHDDIICAGILPICIYEGSFVVQDDSNLSISYRGNTFGPFEEVGYIREINDNLVATVKKDGQWTFVYKKAYIGAYEEIDVNIFFTDDTYNKLVFKAKKENKWFIFQEL